MKKRSLKKSAAAVLAFFLMLLLVSCGIADFDQATRDEIVNTIKSWLK